MPVDPVPVPAVVPPAAKLPAKTSSSAALDFVKAHPIAVALAIAMVLLGGYWLFSPPKKKVARKKKAARA